MNCRHFEKQIELLFDRNTPETLRRELQHHAETCAACASLLRRTQAALETATFAPELHAPAGLKARILEAAAEQPAEHRTPDSRTARHRLSLRPLATLLSAAAMIAAALLLFNPAGRYQAHAARKLLRNAAAELDGRQPLYLEIDIRTLPQENFAYIDARQPFVRHRLWSDPTTGRWRLEKPQRIALNDGYRVLLWNPATATGSLQLPSDGAIEDFAALLDPYTLLLREEARIARRNEATYRKEVGPQTVTLTVEEPAQGDFTNDYMRNSSIGESDTRREYRFDRASGRLTGMKIDLITDRGERTVARMERIDYGTPLADTLFAAPEATIEWLDLTQPVGGSRFAGITPEETARKLFAAMQSWNEEVLSEVLAYYPLDRMRQHYGGCRLIETGEHFRSGNYCGVFVPCRFRKPDGTIEETVLALRRDNPAGAWVADGGL